jgi:hypothetical protein
MVATGVVSVKIAFRKEDKERKQERTGKRIIYTANSNIINWKEGLIEPAPISWRRIRCRVLPILEHELIPFYTGTKSLN